MLKSKKLSMLDFVEFLSSDSDCDDELSQNVTVDTCVPETYATGKKKNDKKTEALSQIQQFRTHAIALEKEKRSQFYNKNVKEYTDFKELQNVENALNHERQKDLNIMIKGIEQISLSIEKFKRDKSDLRKHPTFLEKLKVSMENIESNIMQLKEQQKLIYEDLNLEEKNIDSELESYEKKFGEWPKFFSNKPSLRLKEFVENNKEAALPKEIEEFERFITLTGGHQGGWDDIDHQLFLKLRKQMKSNNELLKKAVCDIPTQSEEDIIQHLQWYQEYCLLRERKRQAIRAWKNVNENKREAVLSNAVALQESENEKHKRKQELYAQEQLERFKKLEDWKAKKEELELQKDKKQKFQEQEKLERIKVKQVVEEKKRWEQKLKIQEYKLNRKEEELIIQRAEDDIMRTKQNFVTIEERERIKERNDKILISKQNRMLTKQYEEEQKKERLERLKGSVAVHADRDPSRLFQMTEGWKRRKQSSHASDPTANVAGVRMLPHRAVPSWRQGMS